MVSPYFQSLIEHSLTVVTEIPEDDVMAVDEAKTFNLASAEGEANLRLRLNDKEVNLEEIEELMEYPKIKRVRFLDLDANEFGDAGVEALAGSAHLGELRNLYLQQNPFTVEGLRALAESQTMSGLRVLYLKANRLGREGAKVLANSPTLSSLRELYLQGALIGQEGLEALCKSPTLKNLRILNLSWNGLDDGAVEAICGSGWKLATLDLYGNKLSQESAETIRASGIAQKLLYD